MKDGLKINYFAFMRADNILRDERSGVFKELVRSGLSHVCVGVERADEDDVLGLNKRFAAGETVEECFKVLSKYPSVFRQATFIVGLENDNRKTLMRQVEFARRLKADYPAFHPLTPVPGTLLWDEMKRSGKLENVDFSHFDWATPILPTKYLSIDELDDIAYEMNKAFANLNWLLKGLFSRHTYKRRLYVWWFLIFIKLSLQSFLSFVNPFKSNVYSRLVTPKWYDK
jgi:radical SAM superfamily enzyme YgiQ (UPF0313 family)